MNVCFNGCSFTVGEGFEPEQRDTYIYDRLVAKHFGWQRENIASPGSCNKGIFLRSADAIRSKKYDIVFSQWSALNRIWLFPGPDCTYSINNLNKDDFLYREIHLEEKFNTKLKYTLRLLNHDYHNILELIKFTNILNDLGEHTNTKVVHINGLIPWKDDLAKPLDKKNLAGSLDSYTKTILDFDNRDDEEIIKFMQELQDNFATLRQQNWVNLFQSFQGRGGDTGPLGHHPGIESHKWIAGEIINYMEKQ